MLPMAEAQSGHAAPALSLQTTFTLLLLLPVYQHLQPTMGVAYSVGEVDHLYTFFVQWSPEIYTKSNKKHRRPRFLIREKHQNRYLVVEKKEVAAINKLLSNPVNPTAENWEIITVKDAKRRLSLCSSEGSEGSEAEEPEYQEEAGDALLPVLADHSQLLDDQHLERLAAHMPARTQGYPWQLVYSTAIHGSSLKTLYRNMSGLDSPVLLVIKDLHKQVFGAFSSDPFRVSKQCYGTGETFLFSFNPDFQAYRWSGENSYFVSGNLDSLQIGGGGGGFGLWLDADLYHGSSFSCPTFHNASLSTHEDFIVQDLEVWTVRN
ncbi:TLD domain-containing protein 2 isoform X1 [Sebastes fasciatus]|uniref:TLD domain-containing protein 2 isoform X1 n=1 Tax=Sebastes fasciatus TaxID=394691 RepID=UPI003D9DCB8D